MQYQTWNSYLVHCSFDGAPLMQIIIGVVVALFAVRHKLSGHLISNDDGGKRGHGISIQKTQILPGYISHRRFFPTRHAFKYSYLTVGIPVRSPTSNWLLSVDSIKWWKRGIFHVTASDYFFRSQREQTLSNILDSYLRSEGLEPSAFPHAYLITSARFLNYKFSPASFWYLYSADYSLQYVIAEVNNTFDERRMYLFHASETKRRFLARHEKDFHVSPFSSRKGSYSISLLDIAREGNLDISVTLCSSKGHTKLVTRWWSIGSAIDPLTDSTLRSLMFVLGWGWTVLVTYCRIVFQAIWLAQRQKLSIWYRPEPHRTTIPRNASRSEEVLRKIFTRYLQHVLTSRTSPCIEINLYDGLTGQHKQLTSVRHVNHVKNPSTETPLDTIEFRIITPQFYRQLVTYQDFKGFLTYSLLEKSEENRTAWCSDSSKLTACLDSQELIEPAPRSIRPDFAQRLLWFVFRKLRATEVLIGVYPEGFPKNRTQDSDHATKAKSVPHSYFLDHYVQQECSIGLQARYCFAVLSLKLQSKIMRLFGIE